jgi:hypothetical protein
MVHLRGSGGDVVAETCGRQTPKNQLPAAQMNLSLHCATGLNRFTVKAIFEVKKKKIHAEES